MVMAHNSRPQARGSAMRPPRRHRIEAPQRLEDRALLAPVVALQQLSATFTAATTPTNNNLGSVTITQTPLTSSSAPLVSVSALTGNSSFGGDIVRIAAGPGGDFGKAV